MSISNEEYILCVQMPNQPQAHLPFPTKELAIAAIDVALKEGHISVDSGKTYIVIHVCPGTAYIVVSKSDFERQAMQQQLARR